MDRINVLIVEDKLLIAEDIASRLKKHSLHVVDVCTTGEDAIEIVKSQNPDLILMDIHLSGALDGISTASLILQERQIPIIYLSEYADEVTIERAKKTQPANYLTKPFNEFDLIRAIDIAFSNAQQTAQGRNQAQFHVFLRTDNQLYVKIALKDILYLEAGRAYCKVITTEKTYNFSNSMSHIYEQLYHKDLVKVHRSFIVNVGQVTSLEGNIVKLGNHEIQMSREYRDNLLNLIRIVK